MKTRFSIYNNGYINQDGSMIEPFLISTGKNEAEAIKNSPIKNFNYEYYIIQEQYNGVYWDSLDDTYKELA